MATEFRSTCGDNYDTNNIGKDWDSIGGPVVVASGIAGMTGNCLQIPGSAVASNNVQKNLASLSTRFIGGRMLIAAALSNNWGIIGIYDTGTLQVGISLMSDGSVRAFLGNFNLGGGTQLCASNPGVVSSGTTFYLGVAVTINNAGEGSVQIYVNNALVANSGGVTTSNSGLNTCNGIQFTNTNAGGVNYVWVDDAVIGNSTGTVNNGVPAPQQVLVAYPSGAGRYTQMTPQGAGANWQCVNSVVTNALATDVAAGTVGLKDAYAMTYPAVSNVIGVSTVDCVKTSDGGSATITPGFSNGSSDSLGAAIAVPSTFQFRQACFDVNPITGLSWTVGDLATLQKLVQRSA